MDAIQKTQELKRIDINVTDLVPNQRNPNEMSDAEFNLLYDNIEQVGLTDPILVRKLESGKYRVIGGHHRLDVAKLQGFEKVPCTVIDSESFTEDQESFQMVRHNVIHGKMSPNKFIALYESLKGKYQEDILAESFGFADPEEFRKMIKKVEKNLPSELKAQFKEAAADLKTIDDLAKLLNRLFSTYGDTLPYHFMIFDYGGKDSVWIRVQKGMYDKLLTLGGTCREYGVVMDSVFENILTDLFKEENKDKLLDFVKTAEQATIPEKVKIPTATALKG